MFSLLSSGITGSGSGSGVGGFGTSGLPGPTKYVVSFGLGSRVLYPSGPFVNS